MKTIELSISGMGCQGCADGIAAKFSEQPGIAQAVVSFDRKRAEVTFDPEIVTETRLREIVTDAGYSAQ